MSIEVALSKLRSAQICHPNAVQFLIDEAIAAIQQAGAKTGEPVAWVVMNGLSKYQVCGAKAPADALCSEMQKRHDLSGSLAAFHVQPLYTHPAPGVPELVMVGDVVFAGIFEDEVREVKNAAVIRFETTEELAAWYCAKLTAAQAQK